MNKEKKDDGFIGKGGFNQVYRRGDRVVKEAIKDDDYMSEASRAVRICQEVNYKFKSDIYIESKNSWSMPFFENKVGISDKDDQDVEMK